MFIVLDRQDRLMKPKREEHTEYDILAGSRVARDSGRRRHADTSTGPSGAQR